MIFIFDENIPPGVVQALRGAGEQARHIIEELGRGSQDEDVFQFLGSHRWYLVTADLRISRNPQQRAALINAGIGAFFFTGRASRNPFQWVQLVVNRWPHIRTYASNHQPPFLCGVPDRGVLRRL